MTKIENIYIHIPFCTSKCDYCAFYSETTSTPLLRALFLNHLEKQIALKKDIIGKVKTIFIGGGTPTLLSAEELKRLLSILNTNIEFAKDYEFTIEANPETLTTAKTNYLLESNINRLSIGVQSFDSKLRKTIGRRGTLKLLAPSISTLTDNGFNNISFDFIYGIPGQTLQDWQNDLKKAVQFPIKHLSAYCLSIEEQTPLAKLHSEETCDSDLSAEMWETTSSFLEKSEIHRYEISNYAQKGFECRHNNAFWEGEEYIGFGPSAVSFYNNCITHNSSSFQDWINNTNMQHTKVTNEERAKDLITLGLRRSKGVHINTIKSITGIEPFTTLKDDLAHLKELELIIFDNTSIRPTEKGLLFHDYIASKII